MTSCGTDHAHIHLVPLDEGIIEDLNNSNNMKWKKCFTSEISLIARYHEYLYCTELNRGDTWNDPQGLIHLLEKPISQFFRKLLAEKTNKTEISNYKKFPMWEENKKTRNFLSLNCHV